MTSPEGSVPIASPDRRACGGLSGPCSSPALPPAWSSARWAWRCPGSQPNWTGCACSRGPSLSPGWPPHSAPCSLASSRTCTAGGRVFFVAMVPFILIATVVVVVGLTRTDRRAARKIDVLGSVLLTAASSTLLLGLSLGGSRCGWASVPVLGLLAGSVLCWAARSRQLCWDPS